MKYAIGIILDSNKNDFVRWCLEIERSFMAVKWPLPHREKRPSCKGAVSPIQKPCAVNPQVAAWSLSSFTFPRSIKWVSGILGEKQHSPRNDFEAVEPYS